MNDRELLELAAKAAGLDVRWIAECQDYYEHRPHMLPGYWDKWNPLTDDRDALRLAVSLGLVVDCSRPSACEPYKQHAVWHDELCDTATLTRRAIVRAAAEIGRNMP
jgi:hypothetical protein